MNNAPDGKEPPEKQPHERQGVEGQQRTGQPPGGGQRPGVPGSGPGGEKPPAQPPVRPPAEGGTRVVPGGDGIKPPVTPPGAQKKPPQDPGATRLTPPGGEKPQPSSTPPQQAPSGKAAPSDGGKTRIVPEGSGAGPGKPPAGAPGKPSAPQGAPPQKPPAPEPEKKEEIDRELVLLRKALSGKYEITKKLGEGGMASVYLAREIALEREVAIKLLPQSYLRDKQFIARFKREAQVAANLEHPHIVRIYQIGEEENLVYFVMSYIPGGSLTDQIDKRGALPVDEIVQWGMDVCSALGYAHDHGVIHRDLKPDNIMLDKSKRAVVMDYGIARAGQGTGLTQTGAVIGTPQFMSPEQARGIDLDSRSDIYSMGLVLYQMATATLPFKATDAASLMYMHVHEAPEPPDVRNKNVPAWLRDIILKCLAKNPDDRFSHAKELRLALAEHKAPDITEKTIIQRRMQARKSKTGIWIAAAIVVIAAAAAGWFWWSSQKPAEQVSRHAETPVQKAPEQQPQQAPVQPQVSADDLAFQQAEMIDTKQAFSTYLDKYPEGSHADAAKEKITAFDEEARLSEEERQAAEKKRKEEQARLAKERKAEEASKQEAAARLDDDAYQGAVTANTAQAYTLYLQSYPTGRHVGEAREKLAGLNQQAAEQQKAQADEMAKRDDEAFRIAMNSNTKDSYSTYLISYPSGKHVGEAKKQIVGIEEKEQFEVNIKNELASLSITMVSVPGGSFRMGSNTGGKDEKPVRNVTVSGFSMSTTEVTQAQYQPVMKDNPSFHKLDDNCPVEKVEFRDAITFCNKLSEKLGLEPCYNLSSGACDMTKNGFRLPTEAEWEFACRAGTGSEYNIGAGESALSRAGWYASNSGEKTRPVGQKTPNSLGLYDLHGNVWEWTNDWYSERSYEVDKNTTDPTGVPSGKERVLRGGSWLDYPKDCTSSKRRKYDPDKNYSDIGFRIVRR